MSNIAFSVQNRMFSSYASPRAPLSRAPLFSERDQDQLEKECVFSDARSIMTTFKYCKDKGRLRPLLSEIAKCQTYEEKVQYIKEWRNMTREKQEQYKKVKKEQADALEKEKRRGKRGHTKGHGMANDTKGWKLFEWRKVPTLQKKKKRKRQVDKDWVPRNTLDVDQSRDAGRRESHQLKEPKRKKAKTKANQSTHSSARSPKNVKQQRRTVWTAMKSDKTHHRMPTPRFIINKEHHTQSFSTPLAAVYRVKRRKTEIKVTVKWALSHTCKSNERRLDMRKRNMPDMKQEDDSVNKTESSAESKHFVKNEKIFAWDKGQLYEAKVMKRKEDVNDSGKMKYYVHYLGYKKSHDRWLNGHDMVKHTPKSCKFYKQNIGEIFGWYKEEK